MIHLEFLPEAREDITLALRYYEELSPSIARQFIDDIDTALIRAQQFPSGYPLIYHDLRQALSGKFPYRIFYQLIDDSLIVFAVLHQSRDYTRILRERLKP